MQMQIYVHQNQIIEIESVFRGNGSRIDAIGQYLLEQQDRLFAKESEKCDTIQGNMAAALQKKEEYQ
jgi:hypothetical protein